MRPNGPRQTAACLEARQADAGPWQVEVDTSASPMPVEQLDDALAELLLVTACKDRDREK
jgi:hypothetical protein